MKKADKFEKELEEAYAKGELVSEWPSKAEKDKFKAAAQSRLTPSSTQSARKRSAG